MSLRAGIRANRRERATKLTFNGGGRMEDLLKDRDEAKAIVVDDMPGGIKLYSCPVCDMPVHEKDNFCPECGQRLKRE